jgi:hypothetical protein
MLSTFRAHQLHGSSDIRAATKSQEKFLSTNLQRFANIRAIVRPLDELFATFLLAYLLTAQVPRANLNYEHERKNSAARLVHVGGQNGGAYVLRYISYQKKLSGPLRFHKAQSLFSVSQLGTDECGEWALLECHLPGRSPEPIGVVLRDIGMDRLHLSCEMTRGLWP